MHTHVPHSLNGFFNAITLTGSARFLVPASVLAIIALWVARRQVEALLMGVSMVAAPLAIYALKAVVDRARPALWETPWYWGSSFPSGHTLSAAAFATVGVMCVVRIWPQRRGLAILATGFAIAWTVSVALSRLVIGVHWPTDVLASVALGIAIPAFFSKMFDLYQRQEQREK